MACEGVKTMFLKRRGINQVIFCSRKLDISRLALAFSASIVVAKFF